MQRYNFSSVLFFSGNVLFLMDFLKVNVCFFVLAIILDNIVCNEHVIFVIFAVKLPVKRHSMFCRVTDYNAYAQMRQIYFPTWIMLK